MKIPRATRAIVAASVMGGALTLVAAGRGEATGHVSESQWIIAAAMGVLTVGALVWPVVVFRGGESETSCHRC